MRINILKNKKFISDVILNIFAAGVTAVILQFGVYPLLNKGLNPELFGEILVMMSVVNIVGVLLGNSLNNIRLIYDKEYKIEKINGDFLIILFFAVFLNLLIMSSIVFFLWSNESMFGNLLLILISVLTMLRAYLTVDYRLNLNYKKVLQHSLVYSLALLLGTFVLFITDIWQLVFFIGEFISFIFLLLTTNLFKESLKISFKFKNTFKQYILLSTSNLFGNILMYIDRIIIFPFLGGHQVAVFFTATVIGKLSGLIQTPISGVVLSYLSNKSEKLTLKAFWLVNLLILLFSSLAFIFTIIISKYLLSFLYSDLYLEASSILVIANLAAILLGSCSISQAIVLKYSATYFQILIQLAYGFVYIVGGLIMINSDGLEGFCIAVLVAAIFKFLLIFVIGTITLRGSNQFIAHEITEKS